MILSKITLENYGPFYGANELDLTPVSSPGELRTIVLFGGKNGAGKTSLFEAVRVCLYGPWFNGTMNKKKYESFINKRIHQPLDSSEIDSATITLEFKYYQFGEENIFKVKREWKRTGSGVNENLEIYKNNSLLIETDQDQWQEFINELIPRGVSNLFFFDGEKIQELANDTEDNILLFESFKSLLGLDLVGRLDSDLSIIKRRKQKEDSSKEILSKIEELEYNGQKKQEKIDDATQYKGQLQSKLDNVEKQIVVTEQKLASEGGTYASKRSKLKTTSEALELQIIETEEKIQNLARGLFPFSLVPKYCEKVKDRLEKEEEYKSNLASQTTLNEKISDVNKEVEGSKFWKGLSIDKKTKASLIEKLADSFNRAMYIDNLNEIEITHDVSSSERNKFLTWVELAQGEVQTHFREEAKKLERHTRRIQSVEAKLKKVPSEEQIKPLIEELNMMNQRKGELVGKIDLATNEIGSLEFSLLDVKRKTDKLLNQLDLEDKNTIQLDLIDKVQDILSIYEDELKQSNVQELEEKFLTCYNILSRKEEMFRHAHIDPSTFTIKLTNRAGNEVSKDHQLSAGEKQLYAISMLWALMKSSNRDLPLIIDTPLARLDLDHRKNIVKHFFPQAATQTIILSTDTEVDKKYFSELEPYISHSYLLKYDSKTGRTQIKDEYFPEVEAEA